MRVHLLRHADAEDFVTTDSARALTEKGYAQADRVGDFLARTLEPIQLILTSPYLRALQTAQAVERKLGGVSLAEDHRLSCGLAPHIGLDILQEHQQIDNILLVGHQPDLSFFAAHLLTEDRSLKVDFNKASLLTLSLWKLNPGGGILESYLNVHQM